MKDLKYWGLTSLGLLLGLAAVVAVVWYSWKMSEEIKRESEFMAKTFVKTTDFLFKTEDPTVATFYLELTRGNEFVPIMYRKGQDKDGRDTFVFRNIGENDEDSLSYNKQLKAWNEIKASGDSTTIEINGERLTVYYGNSAMTSYLGVISLAPFAAVVFFLMIAYYVFSRKQRRERDNAWKCLAMETAHQLGTAITGLKGWRDLLAEGFDDPKTVAASVGKDIERIESVSDRFSHLGNTKPLEDGPIVKDLRAAIEYIDRRTARNVKVVLDTKDGDHNADIIIPHDSTLLQWAVENICKNAADAMKETNGGEIKVTLRHGKNGGAVIDISDTGKGMSASTRRHIFDTGFTTKNHGWGIGLALVKRIIEQYHKGKVYVLNSEIGKGTTFRIELKNKA